MKIFLIALGVLAPLLSACSFTAPGKEVLVKERTLQAYGKVWKLDVMHRTDTQYYFYGITAGGAERPKEFLYLYKEDGSKIDLHERVYALQRDDSYKKVDDCCGVYGSLAEPLISFDGKLIFNLKAPKERVTDCFVHPPSASDNDKRPPGERIINTTFLGEFDPGSERVLLNQFFPGEDGNRETGKLTSTMLEYYQYIYKHRRPFICDQSKRP